MRILFQGDSITDSGRRTSGGCGYETDAVGPGYPGLLKSRILRDHPDRDDIEFVNRAISGNRIVDLYARWKADAINLAPDILSILIGVNDSAAEQEDEQQTNHDERCDDGCKVMVVAQNVTFRTDNGQTPGGAWYRLVANQAGLASHLYP